MGCQTNYSCPITIPSGSAGAAGAAGDDGADGVAILENTIQTSSASTGTGVEVLNTYTITGGEPSVDDIIELECYLTFTSTFVGSVYITFGGSTVATYTILSKNTLPSPALSIILKSRIFMKTASTETYFPSVEIIGIPSETLKATYGNIAINTASDVIVTATTNSTAGTITSQYFLVTQLKKV